MRKDSSTWREKQLWKPGSITSVNLTMEVGPASEKLIEVAQNLLSIYKSIYFQ